MSKYWLRSDLAIGETLVVPKELFIEPEKASKRLETATYIGENESGIFIEYQFRPGVFPKNKEYWRYKMHINWASIWCGHVKIRRTNGEMIRARRAPGQPLALGQGLKFDVESIDN